ncbi:DUF4349 domain-containing protein [Mucilaginibacter sp. AW1-3]
MKNVALTVIALLMLTACEKKETVSDKTVAMDITMPAPAKEKLATVAVANYAPPSVSQKTVTDTSKKITKEGEIEFETGDVNRTRKIIMQRVQALGGYVAEDKQTKDEGSNRKEYNLKVRVPAKNFDLLLDTVSGTADKIDSRNINIKDVTAEYIDTKTRIDNKKTLEARYLQLLQKATRIKDMLEIEAKLEEIRSDIESTQGQLNYMAKQVAYSSLDITFYSLSVVPQNDTGWGYRLRVAFSGGWDALQSVFLGMISCWPAIILVVIGFIFLKRRRTQRNIRSMA